MLKKRVDSNDANAICSLGGMYLEGSEDFSIKKDIYKADKLFHRAAELGSAAAYLNLGIIYYNGDGVSKDKAKAKQYYEKGAMTGCVTSRCILGEIESIAASFDRAIKHWLIAASCGHVSAVNKIKKAMTEGYATRDDYAQALRGYQQYLNEIRSEQRDRAAAYSDEYKYFV
jgi:TPR repeat protein